MTHLNKHQNFNISANDVGVLEHFYPQPIRTETPGSLNFELSYLKNPPNKKISLYSYNWICLT